MAATRSLWQETRTFFPLFLDLIEERGARSVCVVGASDGKFVLPLAQRGIRVVAVERNTTALNGGPVVLPGSGAATMPGLRKRLAEEGLSSLVEIIEADILDLTELEPSEPDAPPNETRTSPPAALTSPIWAATSSLPRSV
ncbi:hypothetical protein ACWCOW_30710, partial [Streptomyces sp. NPDC001939]